MIASELASDEEPFQLMRRRRGGWPGTVAGARWTQGGTGLPGQSVVMRQRLPKPNV